MGPKSSLSKQATDMLSASGLLAGNTQIFLVPYYYGIISSRLEKKYLLLNKIARNVL